MSVPTSTTELSNSFCLFPARTGLPSMWMGLFPSLAMKKSPLFRSLMTPWRREIFHAGPSRDRSTSMDCSRVARPNVICRARMASNTLQQNSTKTCRAASPFPCGELHTPRQNCKQDMVLLPIYSAGELHQNMPCCFSLSRWRTPPKHATLHLSGGH